MTLVLYNIFFILIIVDSGIAWLRENGYKVQLYVSSDTAVGFAFASNVHLQNLRNFGYIVLLDSTHNTNASKMKLFTVYVRANTGVWMPGGHFYVTNESISIIAEGLRLLKNFGGEQRWEPRYFIIDQSSAEEGAIEEVFRGIHAGEMNVIPPFYIKL
jgi:hypothetical protein